MFRRILLLAVLVAAANLMWSRSASGQSRVRWGRTDPLNGITTNYQPPSGYGQAPTGGQPPLGYGQTPPLDPYAMPPQSGMLGVSPTAQPTAPPGFGAYPDPAFAGSPPAQYPNGFGTISTAWPGQQPLRFLQGPRFRWGWLQGNDPNQLGVNEMDVSVAMAFPNFFGSTQPLYVLPSFSLQLWDGPKGAPFPPDADLPGQTYSAFIDTGWESDRNQILGAELGFRIGVFSDFNTATSDSVRIMGKGLVRYRISPALSFRGGVLYVDCIRVKLLPAGGFLWEPNSQTRFDIYFPQPKFSKYCKTIGNQDVWWYIGAEYGGGSWTIERAVDGLGDRFDYNDIRVNAGLEWGATELIRQGRRFGFFEVAWVTSREVIYYRRNQDNFKPSDTFMLRAGFGY